jgi:dinuclear metal center YbgI/SA1388 family protein
MKVKEIMDVLQGLAPFETQMDFDNAGLLIGSLYQEVHRVGVVLDVTMEAVEFAVKQGIDCIVSHHPVIFAPLKSVGEDSVVYQLIRHGICVISAHTNLDAAEGGVNDALASALKLTQIQPLALPFETTPAMGRIGTLLKPMNTNDFVSHVCDCLGTHVKYTQATKEVKTVAVCGGAGADFLEPAMLAGADALVTSELKHHQWLMAKAEDFLVVDAGHFETEQVVVAPLAEMLKEKLSADVLVIPQASPVAYC